MRRFLIVATLITTVLLPGCSAAATPTPTTPLAPLLVPPEASVLWTREFDTTLTFGTYAGPRAAVAGDGSLFLTGFRAGARYSRP